MIEHIHNPSNSEGALEALKSAVVGHRIVSIERNPQRTRTWRLPSYAPERYGDRALITLDNGAVLQLDGHDGGCACSAGCYALTHLAELSDVDNIITAVHFDNRPVGDGYDIDGTGVGYYTIFVVADDRQINLATFEGTDGNGYYGSGYYLRIAVPEVSESTDDE